MNDKTDIANDNGRPPVFKTPEEMQIKIDEFFVHCEVNDIIPLQGELVYFLGFAGRQSLTDYQNKENFSYIVRRAKQKCENALNNLALQNKVNARIAQLNLSTNYGYNEKTEIEHRTDNPIRIVVNGVK